MNKVLLPQVTITTEGKAIYYRNDVLAALDKAGIPWAEESPEQARIRELEAQVESLKQALAKAVQSAPPVPPPPAVPGYKPTIPSRREP